MIREILLPGCVNAQNPQDFCKVLTGPFPLLLLTIPETQLSLSITLDCLVGPLNATEARMGLRVSNVVESPANQHLSFNRSSFVPALDWAK